MVVRLRDPASASAGAVGTPTRTPTATSTPGAPTPTRTSTLNNSYVSDSFNRADSVDALGKADSGQRWLTDGSVWGI
ncbi:MAG: hypothetical protein FJ033_05000 [Chloroflexi bacterium]|nr:hypothetical protein [Chloroflexota bacterium]